MNLHPGYGIAVMCQNCALFWHGVDAQPRKLPGLDDQTRGQGARSGDCCTIGTMWWRGLLNYGRGAGWWAGLRTDCWVRRQLRCDQSVPSLSPYRPASHIECPGVRPPQARQFAALRMSESTSTCPLSHNIPFLQVQIDFINTSAVAVQTFKFELEGTGPSGPVDPIGSTAQTAPALEQSYRHPK